MKPLLITLIAAIAAFTIQAAQLDVAGVLFTDDGIRAIPISLVYDGELDGPVPVQSVVIQMPFQYDQQGGYDPASIHWQQWPELYASSGMPVSAGLLVANPFPGVWRLGVNGLLSWDNDYGDEIVEGWSIPAFLDLPTARVGLAFMPAPSGLLCPIPEPEHALVALLMLGLFAAVRLRRS